MKEQLKELALKVKKQSQKLTEQEVCGPGEPTVEDYRYFQVLALRLAQEVLVV